MVTLQLPADEKPGGGELPPSRYLPTSPVPRPEPQPLRSRSTEPPMYPRKERRTQEQVSYLACKFFGERAASASVCAAFSIIKSWSLLQCQVLLNAISFIASLSSFPTPQSCAAGKTSYFPWQLLYFCLYKQGTQLSPSKCLERFVTRLAQPDFEAFN